MIHGKFMNSKKNTPDVPHEVTESRKKRFTIHENYLDPFIKNVGSALFPTRSERNLTKQLLCKICPRAIYFCFLFCHSATLANNEIKRTNCQYNAILYFLAKIRVPYSQEILNSQSTVFVQKRPVLAYKRRRQGPREQVKLKRLSDFIVYKQVVNYFD